MILGDAGSTWTPSSTTKADHGLERRDAARLDQPIEKRNLAVLVDNEARVLARVVALFSARGYNIEEPTVAETGRGGARIADHHRHLPARRSS